MPSHAHRFAALDGLRFVAAFVVLLFHCTSELELPFIPRGYLAVDFFFALSGFVVAFAYEGRLRQGSYLVSFLRRRFVRLYPLCVLGGVLGFFFHPEGEPKVRDMLLSLGLVPQFHEWLFPVNLPLWSLFFEVVVNVVYGIVLFRLRTRYLVAIFVVVSAYNLYFSIGYQSYDAGGYAVDWAFGFPRALQSFTAGLLLCRTYRGDSRLPAFALLPLTVLLIGTALIAPTDANGVWDWAIVSFVFPLVVVAGMAIDVSGGLRRVLELGGDVSYPLYLIHFPLLVMLAPVSGNPSVKVKLAAIPPVALVICAASVLVYYAYDKPVRRWLSHLAKGGVIIRGLSRSADGTTAALATRGQHRALSISAEDPR